MESDTWRGGGLIEVHYFISKAAIIKPKIAVIK